VKGGEKMYIVTITTRDCQTYVFNTSNLSETFKRLQVEDGKAGEILYLCGFEPMPNCNLIEELAHIKADEITSIVVSKC